MIRFVRRLLHIDEPVVHPDQIAEMRELRTEVDAQRADANSTAERSVTLGRYFVRVNDRNHLAERLQRGLRGG